MTPRFLNLRTGGNLPRARPGMIREGIKLSDQEVLDLMNDQDAVAESPSGPCDGLEWYEKRAAEVYELYAGQLKSRFRWLPSDFFAGSLARHLHTDAKALCGIVQDAGEWDPDRDAKLAVVLDRVADAT